MSESSEHSSQTELSLSISPPPSSVPNQVTFEIQENSGNSQLQNQQSLSSSTNEIEISSSDAPWRGILRKTESKINLNEWHKEEQHPIFFFFFWWFFQKKNQSVPDNYFINVSLAALIKICPFLYQNNNNTFTMNATKMETTFFVSSKLIMHRKSKMFKFGSTGDCSPQLVLLPQAKLSMAENSNILSILWMSTLKGQISLFPFYILFSYFNKVNLIMLKGFPESSFQKLPDTNEKCCPKVVYLFWGKPSWAVTYFITPQRNQGIQVDMKLQVCFLKS